MQQDHSVSGFELSPIQGRLYGVSKGDAAFSCQSVVRIDGPLDVARLAAAVDEVVERYEILRTGFRLPTGRRRPLQVVQESRTGALEIIGESDIAALRVSALESDAPARFHLIRLNDDAHLLALTFHALCGDAQTLASLTDEIFQGYAGNGEAPAEPLQYADFAAWQTELLESEEADAQAARAFWSAPQDAPLPDTLPYQRRLVGDAAFAPETVAVPLSDGLLSRIDAAPADFLLTCWLSLNFRLTGQEEGIAGLSVDGRGYPELVGAPGLFAKSVPLTWSLTSQTSFEAALAAFAAARQGAEENQDHFPLDGPEASPLAFAWETLPAAQSVAGLTVSSHSRSGCTDTYGLLLACGETEGRLVAQIRYDAARFGRADMVRLADQLALLADSAAHAPSSAIGCLALLPDAERQRLLVEVNATDAPFPAGACIHHLFEAQARKTPDAPALVCAGERLTYAELNARANRIAHHLKGQGVGANVPVALCLERSAGMIVGLLAILKAGGYYVPLAADLPAARLRGFLDQSQAKLALTQSSLESIFADWSGATLCLDTASFDTLADTDPEHGNASDDLVYMIFTSGSTGVPKGVGNRHRGLVNYTTHIAGKVGLSAGDALHVGTVSTLSADLGNTSVFPALAFGGCLHVIGYETAMDGERFGSYVRENPLDMLKITPSHLSALLASSSGDILPARYLFLGGEALRWDLLEQLKSRGRCTVINHYGPTETTIGSLTYDTSAGAITPQESATVPIGRPIANTRIYVLDPAGQPVPIGIVGELFIGGAGLASGYVNAPELTAERFVADPFAGGDARMYRTGDRARFLSDGSVEFLGRIDDQVKIRGFRVEPGEVEAVVRRHAEVREAAVLVADDAQGQKRLAGYFVGGVAPEKLRSFLSDYLPDYMIPTTLTAVDALPLNANGKVDRKALLALEVTAEAPAFEAGRTETEIRLSEIWSEILQQERVGIHDDFFALGGHSLLMTQILARIRSVFGVQLALHTLFDNPTVATLAAAIDGEQGGGADDEEMARLLAELEGLSDDEVSQLLQEEAAL